VTDIGDEMFWRQLWDVDGGVRLPFATNLLYVSTLASSTNIQNMSPISKFCHQDRHKVTNIHLSATGVYNIGAKNFWSECWSRVAPRACNCKLQLTPSLLWMRLRGYLKLLSKILNCKSSENEVIKIIILFILVTFTIII